ncbi:magnesium chelatase, partial [Pseudomonas sp. MAFF 311096]|nr:magnesium chelatase [Pseudomonas petroselini]
RLKDINGLSLLACPGLLVDIERGPIRLGRARELAIRLQLEYRHIDQL